MYLYITNYLKHEYIRIYTNAKYRNDLGCST